MNGKAAFLLAGVFSLGILSACQPTPAPAPPPPPAPAPESAMTAHHVVAIRNVRCDALLKLSEDDRASASMFYIGYTASRRRQAHIDVAELSGLEAAALGYCAAYPNWPAAVAFNKSFADNGR